MKPRTRNGMTWHATKRSVRPTVKRLAPMASHDLQGKPVTLWRLNSTGRKLYSTYDDRLLTLVESLKGNAATFLSSEGEMLTFPFYVVTPVAIIQNGNIED